MCIFKAPVVNFVIQGFKVLQTAFGKQRRDNMIILHCRQCFEVKRMQSE